MITFGDPAVFAVRLEWHYDPSVFKPWMYGIFQVFICGESLGSATEEVTLNAILPELKGWRKGAAERSRHRPDLMNTDPIATFMTFESARFDVEHLRHWTPPDFKRYPVTYPGNFHMFDVDGIELVYRVYCVEDDTTSRLLYSRMWDPVKECRVPRAILNDVLFRTIDQLDDWFSQLPEPPTPNQVGREM